MNTGSHQLSNPDILCRDELLELLNSPITVRARAIRELWMQPSTRSLADGLIELEVNRESRAAFLADLRDAGKTVALMTAVSTTTFSEP